MGLLFGVGNTKPAYPYDYWYGIEWDVTVSNPIATRIGKAELHQSLPLHSLIRRCILNDNGKVVYYLHANDSTKRDNGAAADLTGTHGQYMVELPDVYVRFEMDGTKCRCMMSPYQLPGFVLWRKDYISAVEATVQRSTSKLSSVVSMDVDYRGGNNNATNDDNSKTFLGKAASNINLNNFRTYARNRGTNGWNCQLYQTYRKLWWMYAVEYANFNCQAAFNAALTSEGYKQGGLGAGVTTLGSEWNTFNGCNPIIPCGTTNSLGNKTGVIEYALPEDYPTAGKVVSVPSYRGVENPFGHIWKWTDGCKCLMQAEANGGKSLFYVCDNPDYFSASGVTNYELRGELARTNGYVKTMILGDQGEIMPATIGAGTTTYFCDYFYTSNPGSGVSEHGVLFGGNAPYGAAAGFVFAHTADAPALASAHFGSRLCFYPQIAIEP